MSSKSSSPAVIGLNGTTCVSSAEKYSFPSFAIPRSAFSVFSFSSATAPSPEVITSFITL